MFGFGPSAPSKPVKVMKPIEKPPQAFKPLEPAEKIETNFIRRRRSENLNETQPVEISNRTSPPIEQWKAIPAPSVVIYTKDEQIVLPSVPQDETIIDRPIPADLPHFHVTYWMFYPFSQGKTVCTLNLGPLGPIPIPLVPIFNICLGTKKEFGSHVGDWEHMSLFFRGRMEPDVSLSAYFCSRALC